MANIANDPVAYRWIGPQMAPPEALSDKLDAPLVAP